MARYTVRATSASASFPNPPGPMSSPQFSVTGGVELAAGSISTLSTAITSKSFVVTATGLPGARDAYLVKMDGEPIRTYRNKANSRDVTLKFLYNESEPSGTTWAPGNGTYYLYAVEEQANGDLLLAWDAGSGTTSNRIKAPMTVTLNTEAESCSK